MCSSAQLVWFDEWNQLREEARSNEKSMNAIIERWCSEPDLVGDLASSSHAEQAAAGRNQATSHADGGAGGSVLDDKSTDHYSSEFTDDDARATQLDQASAFLARMERLASGGGQAEPPSTEASPPPMPHSAQSHISPPESPASRPASFLWKGGETSATAPLDQVLHDPQLLNASAPGELRQWWQGVRAESSLPFVELHEQLQSLRAAASTKQSGMQAAVAEALGQLHSEVQEWGAQLKQQYETLQSRTSHSRRSLRSNAGLSGKGIGVGVPSADECTAWLAAAGAATCEDEDCVEQYTDELLTARDSCLAQLHAANQRWAGVCTNLGIDAADECGGWSHSDHATFTGILRREADRATAKRGAHASTRAILTDALRKQLPHKSAQALERHWTWSDERSAKRQA